MKKIYNKPEMETLVIKSSQHLLAGSPGLGGEYNSGKPVLSPEFDYEE